MLVLMGLAIVPIVYISKDKLSESTYFIINVIAEGVFLIASFVL
jgi:hypothetical protein